MKGAMSYLLEKEIRQFVRDPFMLRVALIFPFLLILIFPWATTMEVRDIRVSIADSDRSSVSARLVRKIAASDYFILCGVTADYSESVQAVENGSADIVLEIPAGFGERIVREGAGAVQISANTVNGMKGSLGSGYLSSIVSEFSGELARESGRSPASPLQVAVRYSFNPSLSYQHFMIPAIIVMLIITLCGFFPALNIVVEKEKGTIEQINVTPIGKFQFIAAKLIPYWGIGLTALLICLLMSWAVYGLTPRGGFWALLVLMSLFIVTMSGFGLLVSNFSSTLQQAMFVMFFFVIIFLLMSGLFTPIRSMPEWAQWITRFNPAAYCMDGMRGIFLRGAGFSDLWKDYAALAIAAVAINGAAVFSYRKQQ